MGKDYKFNLESIKKDLQRISEGYEVQGPVKGVFDACPCNKVFMGGHFGLWVIIFIILAWAQPMFVMQEEVNDDGDKVHIYNWGKLVGFWVLFGIIGSMVVCGSRIMYSKYLA